MVLEKEMRWTLTALVLFRFLNAYSKWLNGSSTGIVVALKWYTKWYT